jgi:hypothetical protein
MSIVITYDHTTCSHGGTNTEGPISVHILPIRDGVLPQTSRPWWFASCILHVNTKQILNHGSNVFNRSCRILPHFPMSPCIAVWPQWPNLATDQSHVSVRAPFTREQITSLFRVFNFGNKKFRNPLRSGKFPKFQLKFKLNSKFLKN